MMKMMKKKRMKRKIKKLGIICDDCGARTRQERTIQVDGGTIRYRKCPVCNWKTKTFES